MRLPTAQGPIHLKSSVFTFTWRREVERCSNHSTLIWPLPSGATHLHLFIILTADANPSSHASHSNVRRVYHLYDIVHTFNSLSSIEHEKFDCFPYLVFLLPTPRNRPAHQLQEYLDIPTAHRTDPQWTDYRARRSKECPGRGVSGYPVCETSARFPTIRTAGEIHHQQTTHCLYICKSNITHQHCQRVLIYPISPAKVRAMLNDLLSVETLAD